MTWTPAEQVPTNIIPHIQSNLEVGLALIEPAPPQTWAVVMDGFLGWIERFSVIPLHPVGSDARNKTLAAIVNDYRTALSDIPSDLLDEAFKKVIATHGYRNLPLPADVRKHVEFEFRDRKVRVDKLNTAAFILKYRPAVEGETERRGPKTEEEKAQVDKIMEQIRKKLKTVPDAA